MLAPAPGEWATTVQVGPVRMAAGVPSLVRLATSHWIAPRLDGWRLPTPYGPVRLGWETDTRHLAVHCMPCTVRLRAFGGAPLTVARLSLRVQRDFDALAGTLEAVGTGPDAARLEARWTGHLSQASLALQLDLPAAPVAQWAAVLAPALPELPRADIAGTLAVGVQLTLPTGALSVVPVLAGVRVAGLGTSALARAGSSCGPSAGLHNDAWLSRAVIAAEDQRFFTHTGYDLEELQAAVDTNQAGSVSIRGGSTLTQQLAKLLLAGSDRSLERKLREWLYAVEMEQTLGKTRILQLYLDNAPWGEGGLCGAEAAARRYFGRSARSLSPAQAVWLAAMLHNPGRAARDWADRGGIDRARAQWVAQGVRSVPGLVGRRRDAFLRDVASADWASPVPARPSAAAAAVSGPGRPAPARWSPPSPAVSPSGTGASPPAW